MGELREQDRCDVRGKEVRLYDGKLQRRAL